MPSWSENYADFVEAFSDSPRVYSKFAAWTVAGAVLSPSCIPLTWGIDKIRPNFWTVIVGPSSIARKSTQLKVARRILLQASPDTMAPQGGSYEGILERMAKTPVVLFVFDEMRRFFSWMDRKYNVEVKPWLTEIYDWPADMPWDAARAGQRGKHGNGDTGIKIKGPGVSVLTATVDDWLSKSVTPDDFAGGFMVRWLFVPYPGKTKDYRAPIDADEMWERKLAWHLRRLREKRWRFRIQEEPRRAYGEWSTRFEQEDFWDGMPWMKPYATRLSIYALKIAMVEGILRFELKEDTVEPLIDIDEELIAVGTKAVEWVGRQATRLLRDELAIGKFQEWRRDLLKILREKPGEWVPRSKVSNAMKLGPKQLDDVVNALEEGDLMVRYNFTTGRGRPKFMLRAVQDGERPQELIDQIRKELNERKD